MKRAISFVLALALVQPAHARPCPPAEVPVLPAEALTLESGDTLPVLLAPTLEALCLHFDDWARMETDLVEVPALMRARLKAVQDTSAAELLRMQGGFTDAYLAQFDAWEVSLDAIQRETKRADALDLRLRVWRGVALGAVLLSAGLGAYLYVAR